MLQGAVFRGQGFRRPHRQLQGAGGFVHEHPFGDYCGIPPGPEHLRGLRGLSDSCRFPGRVTGRVPDCVTGCITGRVTGCVSARSLGLPVGFVDLPGQACGDPGGVGLRFPDRVEVTPQGLHSLYG